MLTINPSEVIWTILCFFALYFLLKRFLYDPITKHMDERSARIQAGLDEEKKALDEVQENKRELEQARQESLSEAKARIEQDKRQNEQRRADTAQAAKQAAKETQAQAKDEAQTLRRRTEEQFSAHREELAACLADRLLSAGNTAE